MKRVPDWQIEIWKNNILRVWNAATPAEIDEGKEWYAEAAKFCERAAQTSHVPYIDKVGCAGALAALSPCLPWEANKDSLLELIHEDTAYRQSAANVQKAKRILNGEEPLDVLGGLKVRAFYTCIVDHRTIQVCVDRHAKSICYGYHLGGAALAGTNGEAYYDFEVAYQRAAKVLGVKPYQAQAVTWLAWRRLKKEHGKDLLTFDWPLPGEEK